MICDWCFGLFVVVLWFFLNLLRDGIKDRHHHDPDKICDLSNIGSKYLISHYWFSSENFLTLASLGSVSTLTDWGVDSVGTVSAVQT